MEVLMDPDSMATPRPDDRPGILRIHHLQIAVSRLDISLVWYERVLGARRIPALDRLCDERRIAVVIELWSLLIELREDMKANKIRSWACMTLLVEGHDTVVAWSNWFDGWGTPHSSVLVGARGWVLVFQVGCFQLRLGSTS